MSPADYHASLAIGSTAVKDWLDAEAAGDWTTWISRYAAGPMLDRWRRDGLEVPPDYRATAMLVDAARFKSTRATQHGAFVEALLWNPDDPAELEWAGINRASAKELARTRERVELIKMKCPRVREILAGGGVVERQVSEHATVRGVPCKMRVDLAWTTPAGRLHLDFKLWTQWSQDPLHLIERWGAATQAAHYQPVSKATRPDVEHFSHLPVVHPGDDRRVVVPWEYYHEFQPDEMERATAKAEGALDGMASFFAVQEENAA